MTEPIRVTIVGGGIAGAEMVRLVAGKAGLNLTLIEPKHQIECQALYPDYLGGLVRVDDLIAPLKPFCERSGVNLLSDRAIHLEDNRIVCRNHVVDFDIAVVATGAVQNYFGIPGADHAFSINTFEETIRARQFIEDKSPDRIMIIGSGLTGIEAASVLADCLESHIYIIEMEERLLPSFPENVSALVNRILYKKGVNIMTHSQVKEVSPDSISFADGSSLDCDMAIWTTGIKPPGFVECLDLPKKRGWLLVDPYLRAAETVSAIGDSAWVEIDGKLATKTGIEAERQAKHLAGNLERTLKGQPLAQYSVLASTDNPIALISTGCDHAVGIYGQTCVSIPSGLIHSLKIWIDKSIVSRYR